MTLRERIARGERRHRQTEDAPLRRKTDLVAVAVDPRPEWLVRASFRRDLTEADR